MDSDRQQTPAPRSARGFRHFSRVLGLLGLLALVGCQAAPAAPMATASAPAPLASPAAATAPPRAAATPSPVAASFPLTLEDDEGTRVTIESRPERIISLSPAITETVFALGAGERLVGGTDFDDHPSQAAALPDVATFTGVLLEQVVDLEPDLVLAAGNNFTPAADIDRMRELGMPVLVTYAESVEQVLADIRLIGEAIGAGAEADVLTEAMDERIAGVEAAVAEIGERPRVFYQIGSEPEIYGPAPDSFIADMVALAGGEPITTTDPQVFSISVERLVDLDPQVIVLGDAQYGICPEQVAARPGWGSMTAVREGAIRPVDDTTVTRPGPRLAEGLAALALAIHPTAEITPPADAVAICE